METLKIDFDTLAARALNASRSTHKPTYAGLRILLQSLSSDQSTFAAFLERQSEYRKSWRYFGFQVVKEASKGKPTTFRNCVIGSPLTTLVEAHILSLMAREPVFAVPPCAYSYLWPATSLTGRNFGHFLDGYDRRTRSVGHCLTQNPGTVAIVTDLKSFYPSVQKDRLRAEIVRRCSQVPDAATRGSIEQFALSLLDMVSPKTSGLPVGPDISHALAHLALAPVDNALQAQFGNRYFRYVDDIVLIVHQSEVKASLHALRSTISEEGLALNEDKQDEVDLAVWHSESMDFTASGNSSGFNSLLQAITLFLIWKPNECDSLQSRLRDEGFSLPIGRISSLAKSKRFRGHVRHKFRGLFGWLFGLFTTQDKLLRLARTVRQELTTQAERLATQPPPISPQRRRWYVQNRRSVLNCLLYLYSPSEYPKIVQLIPSIDDFEETRLVLDALLTRNCSEALSHPGRVVTSICQLWPEHYGHDLPQLNWPTDPTRAEAEAAAHFALYLSILPPKQFLTTLATQALGASSLIQMCGSGKADKSAITSLSYLDEMSQLFQSIPHDEVKRLITCRFDELEDVGLDGLLLSGGTSLLPGDFAYHSG